MIKNAVMPLLCTTFVLCVCPREHEREREKEREPMKLELMNLCFALYLLFYDVKLSFCI
jgi:hypothetical protein